MFVLEKKCFVWEYDFLISLVLISLVLIRFFFQSDTVIQLFHVVSLNKYLFDPQGL